MATKSVTARIDEERLAWADAYAKQRGVTRTQVLEAGLDALRGDAAGGALDLLPESRLDATAPEGERGEVSRPVVPSPAGRPDLTRIAGVVRGSAIRPREQGTCRFPGCKRRGPVGAMCPDHRSGVFR